MSGRGKRKAFGVTKKLACDKHHCKKHKKEPSKLTPATGGIKHSNVRDSFSI
jgi:hypothetical protein